MKLVIVVRFKWFSVSVSTYTLAFSINTHKSNFSHNRRSPSWNREYRCVVNVSIKRKINAVICEVGVNIAHKKMSSRSFVLFLAFSLHLYLGLVFACNWKWFVAFQRPEVIKPTVLKNNTGMNCNFSAPSCSAPWLLIFVDQIRPPTWLRNSQYFRRMDSIMLLYILMLRQLWMESNGMEWFDTFSLGYLNTSMQSKSMHIIQMVILTNNAVFLFALSTIIEWSIWVYFHARKFL